MFKNYLFIIKTNIRIIKLLRIQKKLLKEMKCQCKLYKKYNLKINAIPLKSCESLTSYVIFLEKQIEEMKN